MCDQKYTEDKTWREADAGRIRPAAGEVYSSSFIETSTWAPITTERSMSGWRMSSSCCDCSIFYRRSFAIFCESSPLSTRPCISAMLLSSPRTRTV